MKAHSDGEGASFLADKRFRPGERVTVETSLDITGAQNGRFEIEIGRRPKPPPIRPQEPVGKGRGAVQEFVTRPDIIPPAVKINLADPGREDGDIFIAPKGGRGHDGPMIIDDTGRTLWFKKMPKDRVAVDLRAQTYKGKPVITWWQGGLIVGDGRGAGMIYDQRYRRVATVRAANGYPMDLHEFTITPKGTALLMSYDRVIKDLRALGGPRRGIVIAGVVQEIDIKTGLVLFEWHSIDSIGLDEGKAPVPSKEGGQYDYLHLNSIDVDENGDFLLSARNTWGVYKVDRATAEARLAPRRHQADVQDGQGHADGLAAPRALAARWRPDDLRQRRLAAGPRPFAGDHRPARRAGQDRRARVRAVASAQDPLGHPGQRGAAAQREHVRRLRLPALLRRVRQGRQARLRRRARARQRQLPRLPAAVDRPSGRAPEGRRDPFGWTGDGERELERRDRGRALGAAGGLQ